MLQFEPMTATSKKILVLLKSTDQDHDFSCPDCGAYVARLDGCDVADLTNPESYALTATIRQKDNDFLGVASNHAGRLGQGYCRNKFYFWDINQGRVLVTTKVKIAYAAAQ
jgi:predicted RNA-binding Zn-ribbon protein involved in translation (DUF1610 family)